MSAMLRTAFACLLVATSGASADPWTDARMSAFEVEAQALQHDLDRSSRGGHGLARLERDFRVFEVRPSQRTPAIERVDRRLRDLGRDQDRRALTAAAVRPRAGPGVPQAYRPPWPEDIRGQDGLIGVGKLVARTQRSLRRGTEALAGEQPARAARHLADADRMLRLLDRTSGGDPTVRAMRAEAASLRRRLEK